MTDPAPPAWLHPFCRPARTHFVTLVRGEGARVFDAEGRAYVDAFAGLWFCQIGHGRARMAEAIAAQVGRLASYHGFEPFSNEPAEQLAQWLCARSGVPSARVFFTSSGSEAVDTVIKLVRHAHVLAGAPRRMTVIVLRHAYHGVTLGGTSAQGIAANREGFGPLVPGFVELHDPDALDDAVRAHADDLAAVLVEPVRGAGGVRPLPAGFLARARARCDEVSAMLVADEVVTGFGRLGATFASTASGVVPDAITFAKGVTSGYLPLGGVVVGPALRGPLEADPARVLRHGHTYSGHPTACAAALENLRILDEEALFGRAHGLGEALRDGLGAALDGTRVTEVRGAGGLAAVEFARPDHAFETRDRMLARGVIARALSPTTLAFCPPLVFTDDDLAQTLEVFHASLAPT